jgi:hypothetical protein
MAKQFSFWAVSAVLWLGGALLPERFMRSAPDWLWAALAVAWLMGGIALLFRTPWVARNLIPLREKRPMYFYPVIALTCAAAGILIAKFVLSIPKDEQPLTRDDIAAVLQEHLPKPAPSPPRLSSEAGQAKPKDESPLPPSTGQERRSVPVVEEQIRTITVEGRLTATLKEGAEIPPASVQFMPMGGGADARLVGPSGEFTLDYVSPTIFRRLEGNRIVVVNTFSLPPSSALVGRPISSLQTAEQVHTPVVTIVYGKALDEYSLGEVTISVNGGAPWYYAWKMPPGTFNSGMVLRFPLRDPANPFKQ